VQLAWMHRVLGVPEEFAWKQSGVRQARLRACSSGAAAWAGGEPRPFRRALGCENVDDKRLAYV